MQIQCKGVVQISIPCMEKCEYIYTCLFGHIFLDKETDRQEDKNNHPHTECYKYSNASEVVCISIKTYFCLLIHNFFLPKNIS